MIEKIADYLRDRIEFIHNWDREVFCDMLYWYASNGLLFAIRDENDEIQGASVVRLIDSKDEGAITARYSHNTDGDTYFVEYMASDKRYAKNKMLDMAVEKLGERPFVAYKRFKHSCRLVSFPAKRFKQIHQE